MNDRENQLHDTDAERSPPSERPSDFGVGICPNCHRPESSECPAGECVQYAQPSGDEPSPAPAPVESEAHAVAPVTGPGAGEWRHEGSKLIRYGKPGDDHNCDTMGCASIGPHVLEIRHADDGSKESEIAALRARLAEAERGFGFWQEKATAIKDDHDRLAAQVKSLTRELAAERDMLRLCIVAKNTAEKGRDRALADLAVMTERTNRAEEIEAQQAKDMSLCIDERIVARAEVDTLRAEIQRLKDRKLKLPKREMVSNFVMSRAMYPADLVDAAIRVAGIEVQP